MALKACKECKREISTEAKTCPNCGKTNPTSQGIVFFFIIKGAAGGGSSTNASSGQSATKAATPNTPVFRSASAVSVDNRKLWQDYEANEVAADNAYKGRPLKVTGIVASIDKDFMDDVVLHLASPNEFMNTMATMTKSEGAKSAALSKGNRVVLLCEGKGRVLGTPALDGCTFEQ